MKEDVRILIADDHEMIRKGLRMLLKDRKDWVICGEASNGRQAVERAAELRPDIVVMDLTMPLLGGLEATVRIRKAMPACEVLILTMHESEQLMREVLAAGARGYILKTDAGHLIVDAIDALAHHRPFFTPGMSQMLLTSFLDKSAAPPAADGDAGALTSRESEIVQLIAEGRSSKEIAAGLGISDQTVETHRANIMRKLCVHSVSEIVRYAIRNHLIEA